MQKFQRAILFGLFGLALAETGASAAGSVRICKRSDLVPFAQTEVNKEVFRLPPLMAFDDFGRIDDKAAIYDASHRWSMTVITLKPLEIAPGQRCVTVPAALSPKSKVRVVSPDDKRDLEFGGFVKRNGDDDSDVNAPGMENVSDLTVTVASTIR